MTSLTVFLIIFFFGTAASFTTKSECLIHYSRYQEGEYEAEENEDRPHGGGGGGSDAMEEPEGLHVQTGNGFRDDSEESENIYPGQGNIDGHRLSWARGYTPTHTQGRHGYLDEEGEWEDRKKRRKREIPTQDLNPIHTQDTLGGQLSCGNDSVIHILNVTVGYSSIQQCYQASPGCQAGSSLAKQIIHCQGNNGVCDIKIGRHYMIRCGHETNFALVFYECIPARNLVDICSNTTADVSDALALTSPNYPMSSTVLPSAGSSMDIITCECTLRAPVNSHLELEYVRTHLPITGAMCEGDLLLLERPDPAHEGRYLMQREICGHNVSNNVVIPSNILRVSFLTGTPLTQGKTGFLSKFKALSPEGTNVSFHLSCVGTHLTSGQVPLVKASSGQTVLPNRKSTTSNPLKPASGLLEWMKVNGRTLPPNIDPSNLPKNFQNMTREELQARLQQSRAQTQKIVGGKNEGFDPLNVNGGHEGNSEDSSSSGVLSGVVASLSSVIVILGSIGAFIFYRRYQRRKEQQGTQVQDVTTPDYDAVYQGNLQDSSSGSVVSAKNHNRPLPNPHSAPGESTTSAPGTSRFDVEAARTIGKNSNTLPSVYSNADSVQDSNDESAYTDETPSKSQDDTTLKVHPQAPPPNSQSTFAPIAPARKKRSTLRYANDTSHDYTSPYDNADDRNISTNQEEGMKSRDDITLPTTSNSSSVTTRENIDNIHSAINRTSNNRSPSTTSTWSSSSCSDAYNYEMVEDTYSNLYEM